MPCPNSSAFKLTRSCIGEALSLQDTAAQQIKPCPRDVWSGTTCDKGSAMMQLRSPWYALMYLRKKWNEVKMKWNEVKSMWKYVKNILECVTHVHWKLPRYCDLVLLYPGPVWCGAQTGFPRHSARNKCDLLDGLDSQRVARVEDGPSSNHRHSRGHEITCRCETNLVVRTNEWSHFTAHDQFFLAFARNIWPRSFQNLRCGSDLWLRNKRFWLRLTTTIDKYD